MTGKRTLMMYGAVFAAVLSLLYSIINISRYQGLREREHSSRAFQQEVETADAITDDTRATAAYLKLGSALPELQLRILQRQWHIALGLLKSIQMCRYTAALEQDIPAFNARLKEHLDAMLDRCSSVLAGGGDDLRPEVMWQLNNIAASAKLLKAFALLDEEKNADKVQGMLRDALSDYKAAIEAVDKTVSAAMDKNIPRWNFELLNSEQYVKKIEAVKTDLEKNQVLKENLETLIPEMGGYAPGEPVETKIRK